MKAAWPNPLFSLRMVGGVVQHRGSEGCAKTMMVPGGRSLLRREAMTAAVSSVPNARNSETTWDSVVRKDPRESSARPARLLIDKFRRGQGGQISIPVARILKVLVRGTSAGSKTTVQRDVNSGGLMTVRARNPSRCSEVQGRGTSSNRGEHPGRTVGVIRYWEQTPEGMF
jgi:hypothetical protein